MRQDEESETGKNHSRMDHRIASHRIASHLNPAAARCSPALCQLSNSRSRSPPLRRTCVSASRTSRPRRRPPPLRRPLGVRSAAPARRPGRARRRRCARPRTRVRRFCSPPRSASRARRGPPRAERLGGAALEAAIRFDALLRSAVRTRCLRPLAPLGGMSRCAARSPPGRATLRAAQRRSASTRRCGRQSGCRCARRCVAGGAGPRQLPARWRVRRDCGPQRLRAHEARARTSRLHARRSAGRSCAQGRAAALRVRAAPRPNLRERRGEVGGQEKRRDRGGRGGLDDMI